MDEKTWYSTDDIRGMISHFVQSENPYGMVDYGLGLRKTRLLCLAQIGVYLPDTLLDCTTKMRRVLLAAADSPTDSTAELQSRCSEPWNSCIGMSVSLQNFLGLNCIPHGDHTEEYEPNGWLFDNPDTHHISASNLRDILPNSFRYYPWWVRPRSDSHPAYVFGDRAAYDNWTRFCSNPLLQDLAQIAYDSDDGSGHLDPTALSILADALEDLDCTDEELILHLRGRRRVKTEAVVSVFRESVTRDRDGPWSICNTMIGSMIPLLVDRGLTLGKAKAIAEQKFEIPSNAWIDKSWTSTTMHNHIFEATGSTLATLDVRHHIKGCWALDSILGRH